MRVPVVAVWLGVMATGVGLAMWVSQGMRELDLELPPLDQSRSRPQGGFFVAATVEPLHLNPLTTSDAAVRTLILRYTHDSLLYPDPKTGALMPAVAEAVELEPGTGALTVRLRPGVVFSDGAALTIADLEFAYRAAKAPGATFGSAREAFDPLDGFETIDARSCRLRVATPMPHVRMLVSLAYPVVQARYWRSAVASLAAAEGKTAPAVGSAEFSALLARVRLPGPGTGAYVVARDRVSGEAAWRRGIDLTLVQNPSSWRRLAQPDCWNLMGLRFRFLSDAAAILAELRAGRLDWYFGEDAEALQSAHPALQQRMRLADYRSPRLGHHMVVWNLRRKPFDDVRVRRALSMLFDRNAIVSDLLKGRGRAAAAWFRPDDQEYPTDLAPMPFDPTQARALLTAAGVVGESVVPFTVTVFVGDHSPLQRRILELALPAFATAGVQLVIERRYWGDVVERYEKRDFDAVLMSWNHQAVCDPFFNFHSSQSDAPGKNYSGLQDPEIDAQLVAARNELDDQKRIGMYRAWAHSLSRLEPVSLLVHPRPTLLIDKRFQDAEPGALGVVLDRFWVAP